MQFARNLSIGTRLMLCFGAIIVLMLAMLGFNLFQASVAKDHAENLRGQQAQRVALAQEWKQNIAVNAQRALAIGLTGSSALEAVFADDMKLRTERTTALLKQFAALETTPEGQALQAKLADTRKQYWQRRDQLTAVRKGGDAAATASSAAELQAVVVTYMAVVEELVAYEAKRNSDAGAAVVAAMQAMQATSLGVALVGVLAAAAMGLLMTRSIVHPLALAQQTADRIADGDLSVDLVKTSQDEVGNLTESLGKMQDALRALVGGIRVSVDSITVASSEVASGNNDLSVRTEQSAVSLQQTASSVEQIASTVRQGAESASQANQLAASASDIARQGGVAVLDIKRTMDGIQKSSEAIADIIGTIDSIAFQTNILALNAAVEAARAGEQGRGFAVVASEVRVLAQRSAAAAKEIKLLIGGSVERVGAGSRQVHAAGDTITRVVDSVQKVSDMVGEITQAAREQAHGIQEINLAVSTLDQATQGNAALVEESAAAASSLKDQAMSLAQSVQRFRLKTAPV